MVEARRVTHLETLRKAKCDLMRLARAAGLPEPDEINYRERDDEVELIWHELKLAVIVECQRGRTAPC